MMINDWQCQTGEASFPGFPSGTRVEVEPLASKKYDKRNHFYFNHADKH